MRNRLLQEARTLQNFVRHGQSGLERNELSVVPDFDDRRLPYIHGVHQKPPHVIHISAFHEIKHTDLRHILPERIGGIYLIKKSQIMR
jgi:hypothetical protein